MIRIRELTLARGGIALLDHASALINPGERVALVGPNGSGKSTLLGAFAREVVLDGGDIEMPTLRMIKLEQALPTSDEPAWRHVLSADAALMSAERALETAELDMDDGIALAHAHDHWDQAGGHTARARIGELLAGLGFTPLQVDQPVGSLSGGWRMRLNLARALFVTSDLLLLDEPTNHLDLDAIVWLERWLRRYQGMVVVVSHDRDFLDRVADATLSIEDTKLVRYAGGYSSFERLRGQRMQQASRDAASQAQRVAQLTSFIERFRAKATKARQAQSRIKALEKLVDIAPLRIERGVDFSLPSADDAPDPLILVHDLACGYGDTTIVSGVGLTLGKNARIGLLGRNGAGKSTLIRTLVGDLPALHGELRRARSLRVGYFAQHAVEQLRPEESPLAMLKRTRPGETESALRNELGRFGFSGDDATRPIGPMSGGEKARLVLSTIVHLKPHVLVLDEPTNHLDAATRDTLTDALADFDGALVLVSHDRYLMRATVDELLLVHDGGMEPFEGDLDDYLEWLQKSPGSGTPAKAVRGEPAVDKKEERKQAAARRQQVAERLKPLDKQIRGLEADLAAVEKELAALATTLADPKLYTDPPRAADLGKRKTQLDSRREDIELRWLRASEQREQLASET